MEPSERLRPDAWHVSPQMRTMLPGQALSNFGAVAGA